MWHKALSIIDIISIWHKALNIIDIMSIWHKALSVSDEANVSFLMKQQETSMAFKLKLDALSTNCLNYRWTELLSEHY